MNVLTDAKYNIREMRDGQLMSVEIEGIRGLDLSKTFDCGQCFRFEPVKESRHETEWGGIAFGRAVSFASESNKLYIYNSSKADFENLWSGYLGLDVNYDTISEDILSRSDSEALARAVEYGNGIRILKQEKWETLCSFIISPFFIKINDIQRHLLSLNISLNSCFNCKLLH